MIKYALKCDQGHQFESWFQSADAFDALKSGGHVSCMVCGTSNVTKAVMAPNVTAKDALSTPQNPVEEKIAEMRKHLDENATYVGNTFATEARAMHEGDSPKRSIWGEANLKEAKSLLEDGVPVAPLPFAPSRKAN